MKSLILALVQSDYIREELLNQKDQFIANLEFIGKIEDYYKFSREFHIGLLIVENELLKNSGDEERIHLFNIDCARVIISTVRENVFTYPVPGYAHSGKKDHLVLNDFVKYVNQYFRPVTAGNQYSEGTESNFITRNNRMLEIYKSAKRVAQFNTHILLLGESGTGKDVLARLIHRYSKRNSRPIIKVNCAAIPSNLLETELFGYRKGAFTNAFEDKTGKIQMANGSTLFLDEIGELDLALQAKLLRVIETGEVDVIGGIHPVKVNIRVISATNRDLSAQVRNGLFREDLYYRLNVVRLHLIPLRERPDDIPLLIQHFIQRFNRKYNKNVADIPKDAFKEVFEYTWPGNVRELLHFTERLVVQCQKNVIDREIIQKEFETMIWESKQNKNNNLNSFIMYQEKQHILRILSKNHYRIIETADELGISRTSLFRRLRKYGINVNDFKKND